MTFSMIAQNQNMEKNQNYVTWVQTALQSIQKQKVFTQTLQKKFKTRFYSSNYELDRPLPEGKNKN